MSRVQILDVGDTVLFGGSEICVVSAVNEGTYNVTSEARRTTWRGIKRHDLIRLCGANQADLQMGDHVKVTGRIEPTRTCDWTDVANAVGIIVAAYEGQDADFMVAIAELHDLYECRADQLRRITKAEALA